jgi:hypothetical protein
MGRIISYSDTLTSPVRENTNNTTHKVAYSLSEAPTADVTVSISIANGKVTASVASLTFTTLNWHTPQTVTYTAVDNLITDVIAEEIITLSASGGGYAGVSLSHDIFVYDSVTGTYYYKFFGQPSWMDFHHLANGITATRDSVIDWIFNGNGLPSGHATLTVMSTSHSGTMHTYTSTDFTGFSAIHRYRVTWTDVDGYTWTHYLYLLLSSTPIGKLLIDCQGHETDKAQNHQNLINQALSNGIDVLFCAMPVLGENVETNPTITLTGTAGHNQMLTGGLDRVGYSPLELFFFDKVIAINYIQATYSYGANIFFCGISGGGWTATLMGAMDTRIMKTICDRGVMPLQLSTSSGDYEQGTSLTNSGSRLYTDFYRTIASISDMIALCCTGNRMYKSISNSNDTTVGHVVWNFTYDKFVQVCSSAGGTYKKHIWNTIGDSAHAYSTTDIAQILNEL